MHSMPEAGAAGSWGFDDADTVQAQNGPGIWFGCNPSDIVLQTWLQGEV